MKQGITLVFGISLAFTGQFVSAGTITDIYNTNDVLTTTTFNNIKAQVNDNDTRITASTHFFGAVKHSAGIKSTKITSSSPTATQNMNSIKVTPPADGYVVVTAVGTASIIQTVLENNFSSFSITTAVGSSNADGKSTIHVDTSSSTTGPPANISVPLFVTSSSVAVTQGFSITFYLTAYRDSAIANNLFLEGGNLTATFYPVLLP